MSRRKEKTQNPERRRHPGVRTKIYVRDDMIGGGKVDLLRLIAQTGSITAAAKEMGVGYRRAWFLLETLQRCFAEPLFETERGGPDSGGTRITPLGAELLAKHAAHEEAVLAASNDFLVWLETQQPQSEA